MLLMAFLLQVQGWVYQKEGGKRGGLIVVLYLLPDSDDIVFT